MFKLRLSVNINSLTGFRQFKFNNFGKTLPISL